MSVTTDGMTLLPEPDWARPLESFKPKKNGYVVARKDGGNGGKWVEPFSDTWCFEPAEHGHHVSSFVACGMRAVCGGWAPCGCWQRISLDCVSFDPCQKHGGSFAGVSRKRVAPQITGYTRAKRLTWDDIRPGQVWRWSGNPKASWVTVQRIGHICRIQNQKNERLGAHILRTEFERGEWTMVRDVEPSDTMPSPPAVLIYDNKTRHDQSGNDADLQPGIPGEPTYADHRQRYLDAMLRGERVHPPEWDKQTGSYVQCACWHCQGCDAGRWSSWDHDEAERKIQLAESAAKAIGYGLWTWGMGGRTLHDGSVKR